MFDEALGRIAVPRTTPTLSTGTNALTIYTDESSRDGLGVCG
jgi:hypothetical protein